MILAASIPSISGIERSDTKIVILKADKDSKMEIAVKVLDLAKSFGAEKLIIATKKEIN
jgi:biopolymer transport protein ExbD